MMPVSLPDDDIIDASQMTTELKFDQTFLKISTIIIYSVGSNISIWRIFLSPLFLDLSHSITLQSYWSAH